MDERPGLASVLERISDGVYALDREWRYTFLNAAAERQIGRPAAEVLGRVCWEVFPETLGSAFEAASRSAERSRTPVTIVEYFPPLDTWFESTYHPSPDGITIVSRDVTAQKRAEELLEESQRSGQIGSWTWDLHAGSVHWSSELWRILGLTPGSRPLTPTTFQETVHPEDRPVIRAAADQAFRVGTPYALDVRIVRPDGEVRWVHARGRVTRDDHDHPARMLGSCQDVTERMAAAAALREREVLLRTITDNATLALFLMDHRQHCTFMSRAAEELTGFTLAEVQGRPLHDVVHHTRPDGTPYPLAECPIDRALPERARTQGEEVFVHKDGHFYPVAFTASPIVQSGVPVGTVIEVEDLTARQAAEARLVASERRQRLALDAAQAGTFDIDASGETPPIVTDEVLRLFGFPAGSTPALADFLGRVHPEDRPQVVAVIAESAARGAGHDIEYRVERPDGTVAWLASRAEVVAEPGQTVRLVGVLLDATDRRTAQQQQQEFLEAVSHDLKNPLASVRAHVQLLQRRARKGTLHPETLPEALAKVDDATRRMEAQIGELQDLARLRAGHPLELHRGLVNLAELAEAAAIEASQLAPERRVRVELEGRAPVGTWDALRLRRVIDNLLTNALKYSDQGDVTVTVAEERHGGCAVATLAVRDEGLGIPAADLPHVFERFRRGSNVTGRQRGTGIGLAGARQIVEQHGGTIAVESVEGAGSTFTVALPLVPAGSA